MTYTIKTKRLGLRVPSIEDAEFIQREFPKWELVKYLNNNIPWPYPDDGAELFLKEVLLPDISSGKSFGFIIELIEGGIATPIGLISYQGSKEQGVLGRGFWLALDYHGKGYMSEASLAGNKWIFQNTNTHAITTNNALTNTASSKIKVKQGWELISKEEADLYMIGQVVMCENWLLTKERWEEINDKR
tara:strand:- start:52919 stop:53485 length:567 start_codon:yes stop_codon:yes gene_type:complete